LKTHMERMGAMKILFLTDNNDEQHHDCEHIKRWCRVNNTVLETSLNLLVACPSS
jgi:spore germination protein GerM